MVNTHHSAWLTCDDDPCCAPTVPELAVDVQRMVRSLGRPSLPYSFISPAARAAALAPSPDDPPVLVVLKDLVAVGVECAAKEGLEFSVAIRESMMLLDWMAACCPPANTEVAVKIMRLWFVLLPRTLAGPAVACHPFWSCIVLLDPGLHLATKLVQ